MPNASSGEKRSRKSMGRWIPALLSVALIGACGGPQSDIEGPSDGLPFGGKSIKFQSTYAYFPSDFAVSVVRDTMPQDEACRILNMYSKTKPPLRGLPVLPYSSEHFALVMTVESAMAGDDVTIDPTDRGGVADMRYAVLGQYDVGKNSTATMAWPASGVIRISALESGKHIAGEFKLQFPGGEHIEESFDVNACP